MSKKNRRTAEETAILAAASAEEDTGITPGDGIAEDSQRLLDAEAVEPITLPEGDLPPLTPSVDAVPSADPETAARAAVAVDITSVPVTRKIGDGIATAIRALEMQGNLDLAKSIREGNRGPDAVNAARVALMRHNPDLIKMFEKEVTSA